MSPSCARRAMRRGGSRAVASRRRWMIRAPHRHLATSDRARGRRAGVRRRPGGAAGHHHRALAQGRRGTRRRPPAAAIRRLTAGAASGRDEAPEVGEEPRVGHRRSLRPVDHRLASSSRNQRRGDRPGHGEPVIACRVEARRVQRRRPVDDEACPPCSRRPPRASEAPSRAARCGRPPWCAARPRRESRCRRQPGSRALRSPAARRCTARSASPAIVDAVQRCAAHLDVADRLDAPCGIPLVDEHFRAHHLEHLEDAGPARVDARRRGIAPASPGARRQARRRTPRS